MARLSLFLYSTLSQCIVNYNSDENMICWLKKNLASMRLLIGWLGLVSLGSGYSQDPTSYEAIPLSFTRPPYFNPCMIERLQHSLHGAIDIDSGEKIEPCETGYGGFFKGEICSDDGRFIDYENEGCFSVYFGYNYLGKTDSGIYVLNTYDRGGGSGCFEYLLFFAFERRPQLINNNEGVTFSQPLQLRKVGEISLCDRP